MSETIADGFYIELAVFAGFAILGLGVALSQLLAERLTTHRTNDAKKFFHRGVAVAYFIMSLNIMGHAYNVLDILPERGGLMFSQNVTACLFVMGGYFIYSSVAVTYAFVRKKPPAWLKSGSIVLFVSNTVILNVLAFWLTFDNHVILGALALMWMMIVEVIMVIILNVSVGGVIRTVSRATNAVSKAMPTARDSGGHRVNMNERMKRLQRLRWIISLTVAAVFIVQGILLLDGGFTGAYEPYDKSEYLFGSTLTILQALILSVLQWWAWIPIPLETPNGFCHAIRHGVSIQPSRNSASTGTSQSRASLHRGSKAGHARGNSMGNSRSSPQAGTKANLKLGAKSPSNNGSAVEMTEAPRLNQPASPSNDVQITVTSGEINNDDIIAAPAPAPLASPATVNSI